MVEYWNTPIKQKLLNNFEKHLKEFREFIFRKFSQNVDMLYHYTTNQSGKLILKNQSLWITNMEYLNDTTEWTYGIGIFKSILKSGEYQPELVDFMEYSLEEMKYESQNFFIFSLSDSKENTSLWMNYAQLDGVALGIDVSRFKFHLDEMSYNDESENIKDIFSFQYGKVIYQKDLQEQIVLEVMKNLNNLFTEYNLIIESEEFKLISKSMLFDLVSICSLFKDSAFKQENEYRFIIEKGSYLNIKTRLTKYSKETPYIELNFLDSCDMETGLPIAEIHTGIHNTDDCSKIFINEDSIYKNPIVTKSKLPIRKPSF